MSPPTHVEAIPRGSEVMLALNFWITGKTVARRRSGKITGGATGGTTGGSEGNGEGGGGEGGGGEGGGGGGGNTNDGGGVPCFLWQITQRNHGRWSNRIRIRRLRDEEARIAIRSGGILERRRWRFTRQ